MMAVVFSVGLLEDSSSLIHMWSLLSLWLDSVRRRIFDTEWFSVLDILVERYPRPDPYGLKEYYLEYKLCSIEGLIQSFRYPTWFHGPWKAGNYASCTDASLHECCKFFLVSPPYIFWLYHFYPSIFQLRSSEHQSSKKWGCKSPPVFVRWSYSFWQRSPKA